VTTSRARRGAWLAVALAAGAAAPNTTRADPPTTRPAKPATYQPTWESIDRRPIPPWFGEAKFGIFVVWGPYSVPSWVDRGYAEWYWKRSQRRGSAVQKFHHRVYGKDFPYERFAEMLTAELWDPDAWAGLFARSGAKYVVTTANYHDGFCLWPSPYSKTKTTDKWNAAVVGPKRDVLGELFAAGRKRGLKMGIYYSLYEWYHPLWLTDRARYVTEHLHPQFKDVVTRYKPHFIFLDGEWEQDCRAWRSLELAAWLYNESPCREYVVTNDRWGKVRGRHGDVFESEYGGGRMAPTHPWQEDRGIGRSYGYNRKEGIDDYDSEYELIRMLSRVCGNGGNFLLDVGPTADGRIPVIMQDRLVRIGQWLKVNGEAIYGSKASPFWPRRLPWGACTAKPGKLYLHLWGRPKGLIRLRGLVNRAQAAYALADAGKRPLAVKTEDGAPVVAPPPHLRDGEVTVLVLEIAGEPIVDLTIRQSPEGNVGLLADAARLHGRSPRLEAYDEVPSIGYWSDPKDSVSWEFVVARPGTFDVTLEASCAKGAGGSEFVVSVAGQKLECRTVETGDWGKFVSRSLGRVRLPKAGKYTLTVQPKPKPKWQSMGLRWVLLSPAKASR